MITQEESHSPCVICKNELSVWQLSSCFTIIYEWKLLLYVLPVCWLTEGSQRYLTLHVYLRILSSVLLLCAEGAWGTTFSFFISASRRAPPVCCMVRWAPGSPNPKYYNLHPIKLRGGGGCSTWWWGDLCCVERSCGNRGASGIQMGHTGWLLYEEGSCTGIKQPLV